jgi:hypothetical protein
MVLIKVEIGQTENQWTRQQYIFLFHTKQRDNFFVISTTYLKHQNNIVSTKNCIKQNSFNILNVCHGVLS